MVVCVVVVVVSTQSAIDVKVERRVRRRVFGGREALPHGFKL
jgi:hypothetical protein